MNELPGPESLASESPTKAELDYFNELFPGLVQDGVLDAEKLGQHLGLKVSGLKESKERFGLMWAGKKKAVEALQTQSFAALHPDFDRSSKWETAENVFIEGDNLEILKLLQNAYNDQVKLIYLDPPYNTGNDFVYNDDFSDPVRHYLEVTGQLDALGNRLVASAELTGRKHSNWLTMMYPRLVLARNLLTQDGLFAMSIDRNEIHHSVLLLNEIFGEENLISVVSVVNNLKGRSDESNIATAHEYLVLYTRGEFVSKGLPLPDEIAGTYKLIDPSSERRYRLLPLRKSGTNSRRADRPNMFYPFYVNPDDLSIGFEELQGWIKVLPLFPDGGEGCWRWGIDTARKRVLELQAKKMSDGRFDIQVKDFLDGEDGLRRAKAKSVWLDPKFTSDRGTYEIKELFGDVVFDHPKPVEFLKEILELSILSGDIVMDFFAGSGTTGQAVMEANKADGGNRKFVLVTLDEPAGDNTAARALGYETISQITTARLQKAAEKIGTDLDLRVFKLGPSNFKTLGENASFDQLDFGDAKTLKEGSAQSSIAAQLSLKLGSRLDEEWETIDGVNDCWKIGNVLVHTGEGVGLELIQLCLSRNCGTLALLEDFFENRDDLKANLYFACKKANITLKTF